MSSDIFDSAIGKPEKQSYQSTSSTGPWAAQQPYLQNMFGYGEGLYNRGPFSYAPSSNTRLAETMTAQKSQDPNSLTAQSQRQLGDTISGKYLDPKTNPYLEGSVNDALGLAKSQFLGLYGGGAGNNVGNSGFQEQLARTLANTALPAYQNAYAQERQNQLNAMNLAPPMDYANINPLMTVGASQDARNKAAFQSPWENLARYQASITGNYGGVGVGTREQPWNNQLFERLDPMNPSNDPNGGYSSTLGAAGSFFSDVRLKENIERIGTADAGYGIYRYNYKGDDKPQIGVLAQEVEQVKPEAVGESQGYKTVNYRMI